MAHLKEDELIAHIVETFHLEPFDPDMPLFSSSLLDSINMVEVVSYLEDRVGITVDANDLTLENFDTVSAIASFCRNCA